VPDTFQALGVLLIALLPGALYIWGFEREAGRWGISAADRVLRFVGASAMLHAAAFPLTWAVWKSQLRSGQLSSAKSDWVLLWVASVIYVAAPVLFGSIAGVGTRREWRWVRFVAGRHPAPRGWDHLFATEQRGWIRMKLKSGPWLGGVYANVGPVSSYAAGYPDAQDLYLAALADLDPVTGEFRLEDGHPVTRPSGLLVRWDEIEYLEFTPADLNDVKEAAT
jgi:Family of unknown function (DUF6338)